MRLLAGSRRSRPEVDVAPQSLYEEVLAAPEIADLEPAARRLAVRSLAGNRSEPAPASEVREVLDLIDGYGPLTPLMEEASLTDLLVNGPDEVWVDRGAGLERTAISMEPAQLESLVGRLADRCGIRVDMSRPVADGSLPDGARLHVVLPPVARRGPLVSIRRFPRRAFSLDDLVERSMMSVELAAELRDAVVGRASILVSGATGTGKTTLMGALLGLVPETERVVLIEETPELPSSAPHAVALVTRQPNVEGRGEVTMADLVRAALRMRPDRIVIGEVRGPEASAALGALSTGHEGSMMTLHARSAAHALQRFVSLALEADGAAPQGSLEARAMDSIDAVVHLSRDGLRRVVEEISWLH